MTVPVDAMSGVAGFITPSSHVDIYAVLTGTGGQTKAAPILSDVEVIAVDQSFTNNPESTNHASPATSVTVAVTAEDARKLIKAITCSKAVFDTQEAETITLQFLQWTSPP